MGFSDFCERPLRVAERLACGDCGGSYIEACLLISAVISGGASLVWPGEGKDHKRFVEIWARHADPSLNPVRISVPLLVRWLVEKGRLLEAEALRGSRPKMFGLGYGARIVTGNDIDANESEIRSLLPGLSLAEIRAQSYPSLYYRHVRSSLTHEYELSDRSVAFSMTSRQAGVSYSNHIEGAKSQRRIHFEVDWLIAIARAIAAGVDGIVAAGPAVVPNPWWLKP